MAESNKKGMISGMDSLVSISGEEFLEVIRLESDGSYKNYKLPVSKIRNNAGLSAYEIAVQNGFVGTVDEWLASLEGKSAYQIAVDGGFVGNEAAFIASLKGEKGEDGDTGKSIYDIALENGFIGTEADFLKTLVGKSAYQTALDNGFVGTETEWLLSIKGDKGDDGEQGEIGPDGKSAFEVWQELPGNAGKPESEYIEALRGVTGDSAYEAAVAGGFVGTEAQWLASLEGKSAFDIAKELNPALVDEAEFIASLEGKTAYETAVENGFVGTEAEWIASLHGDAGKSAYQSALDTGFVGTEAQWIASLEGSDGNNGTDGEDGAPGASAYDTYKTLPGNADKTEQEFIDSLKGENGTDGTDGSDGASAYDTWLTIPGNEGKSEAEFIESIKGAAGNDGTDGSDGQSAYQVAVAQGFVGTVDQWLASLEGEKGDTGAAINVVATVSQADFDQIVSDGLSQPGDAYIVGERFQVFNGTDWIQSNSVVGPAGKGLNYLGQWPDNVPLPTGSNYNAGDTYVWKNAGVTSLWTLVVQLDDQGVETSRSWVDIGVPGPQGDSAYQTWLKQAGNAGKTEQEFIDSIQGEQGEQGNDGTDGKSAYQLALDNGFVGTEVQWLASLKGEQGEDGEKGDPATAFEIKGQLTDVSELPTPGNPAEAYYVGRDLYVWIEATTEWKNFGSLNGDSAYQVWEAQPENAGKTVEQFLDSLIGQSAYALWESQTGNTGKTEAEFLASLKGTDGVDGVDGIDGTDGRNLQVKGSQPNQAAIEALPTPADQDAWTTLDTGHLFIYVGNAWVDAGKFRGDDGTNGVDGTDGASAFDAYLAIPGNEGKTEQEFIDSLKGEDGADGVDGTDGRNVVIKGSVANQAALPTGAAEQDAYTVQDTGHLFMWIAAVWVDLGQFKGDKGDAGEQGIRGLTGLGLNIVGEYDLLSERPDPSTLESGDAVFVLEDSRLYQVNAMGTYNVGILLQGPDGPEGPQGEKGDDGAGVNVMGIYPDLPALQAAHPTGNPGEGYLIGQNLYLYISGAWTDVGEIRGPRGEQGIRGLQGLRGLTGEKGPRGSLWLKLDVETPSAGYGTEGDWAVNDALDVFYKSDSTTWVPFGKLTAGDMWSPALGLGKVVRLGEDWIALPVDEVANPQAGVFYVRALKSGSTTETEWVALPKYVTDDGVTQGTTQYVRVFEAAAQAPAWKAIVFPTNPVGEAPTTANVVFGRRGDNASWVAVLTAPADAKKYLRTNNAWVAFDSYDTAFVQGSTGTTNFDLSNTQMVEIDNTAAGEKIVTINNVPAVGRCTTAVIVVKGNVGTVAIRDGNTNNAVIKWNGETAPVYTTGYNVVTLLVYKTSAGNVFIGATGAQGTTLP